MNTRGQRIDPCGTPKEATAWVLERERVMKLFHSFKDCLSSRKKDSWDRIVSKTAHTVFTTGLTNNAYIYSMIFA